MRFLSILLVISLLLSLAACNNASESDENKSSEPEASSQDKIVGAEDGFELGNDDFPFLSESDSDSSTSLPNNNENDGNGFDDENGESSNPESLPEDDEPEDEKGNGGDEENNTCEHKIQVTVNMKVASCSTNGYTGDKVCADCGKTVKKGSVVNKTAHATTIIINRLEPTLSATGYTGDKLCNDCKTIIETGAVLPKIPIAQVLTPSVMNAIKEGFVRLINEERASVGLGALMLEEHLDYCAKIRANEIIDYFSHTRPNGESCFSVIDRTKYNWSSVGENIGYVSVSSNDFLTPESTEEAITEIYTDMFKAFKNSPLHYANIISSDYEDMGVGISYSENENQDLLVFHFAHFFGKD